MNSNIPLRDCQEAKYGRLEQQSSIFPWDQKSGRFKVNGEE